MVIVKKMWISLNSNIFPLISFFQNKLICKYEKCQAQPYNINVITYEFFLDYEKSGNLSSLQPGKKLAILL